MKRTGIIAAAIFVARLSTPALAQREMEQRMNQLERQQRQLAFEQQERELEQNRQHEGAKDQRRKECVERYTADPIHYPLWCENPADDF